MSQFTTLVSQILSEDVNQITGWLVIEYDCCRTHTADTAVFKDTTDIKYPLKFYVKHLESIVRNRSETPDNSDVTPDLFEYNVLYSLPGNIYSLSIEEAETVFIPSTHPVYKQAFKILTKKGEDSLLDYLDKPHLRSYQAKEIDPFKTWQTATILKKALKGNDNDVDTVTDILDI